MTEQRDKIREAVAIALTDIDNYPRGMQAAAWGANLGGLIDTVTDAVLNTSLVEQTDMLHNRPNVSRVLVADQHGIPYQTYRAEEVVTSLQDNGHTLKVFLRDGNK